MPVDVANLLLRVTSDSSGAQRDLTEFAAKLEAVDQGDADVTVDVDTAGAEIELAAIEAQVSALDGRDINIDTDISGLSALGPAAAQASSGLAEAGAEAGRMAEGLTLAGAKSGLMVGGIAVLAAVLTPLIASLGAAAIGVGGLALAFGAALGPAILLAAVGLSDFSEQSKIAGTAANTLKNAFTAIKAALQPAANTFVSGLAAAFQALVPLVQALQPAFQVFAQSMAVGFQIAAQAVAALGPQLAAILVTAAQLAGPIGTAIGALAQVFANLAVAIMPVLVQFLQQAALWLQALAARSGDIAGIRTLFSELVATTRAWFGLVGALSSLFLSFVRALNPIGTELVTWLTGVVRQMTAWLSTRAGQAQIRAIFAQIVPLVKSILTTIGLVARLFASSIPLWAPLIQGLFDAFNSWLSGIQSVISALKEVVSLMSQIAGMPSIGSVTGSVVGNPEASTIGGLMAGGIVSNPLLSLVGEGRHDEAVIPLSNRVLGGLAGQLAGRLELAAVGGGGEQHFHTHVTVPGGGSPDEEVLVSRLTRKMKMRG